MKIQKDKGQALIEVAMVLALLLVIIFFITEFARAWYIKNSLKNAVRHGVRIAVVTRGITTKNNTSCGNTCPAPSPANSSNDVIAAVCCSPGVQNSAKTTVNLTVIDDNGLSGLNSGDTVRVGATTSFDYIIGGRHFTIMGVPIWPWPKSTNIVTDASMRYE